MMYQLEWTDRKGGYHSMRGEYVILAKRLETLRCPADLWMLDAQGVKIDTVGGCEPADGHDDKRIKWQWWYERVV